MELSRLQKLCVRLFRACGMSLEVTQVLVAWLPEKDLKELSAAILSVYDETGELPKLENILQGVKYLQENPRD